MYALLYTLYTYILQGMYKSMYFMGDLRDFQGEFWLCVILGLEHDPRVRCDSTYRA
jgi:hypothetical protein